MIQVGDAVRARFFDSMTMKNRVEAGIVKRVRVDGLVDVQVERPIRKVITTLQSEVVRTSRKNPNIRRKTMAKRRSTKRRKMHTGPRGGRYFIRKGRKVYR